MAKVDKDKIKTPEVSTAEEVVIRLWCAVVKGEIAMPIAEQNLHAYVNALSEEKQQEFRDRARVWGRLLMSVTEAFSQQLTVIGAGQ